MILLLVVGALLAVGVGALWMEGWRLKVTVGGGRQEWSWGAFLRFGRWWIVVGFSRRPR